MSTLGQYPTLHLAEEEQKLLKDLEAIRNRYANTNSQPQFAEIRDRYPEAARIFFRGQNLRYVDLGNADLRSIDFRGTDLTGTRFNGAAIEGARFELAKVSRDALRAALDWRAYVEAWRPADLTDTLHFRRLPWERFSLSPLLPELVLLPEDLTPPHNETGLSEEEDEHLAAGRLAIATSCLGRSEWDRVVMDAGMGPSAKAPAPFKSFAATSYCAELTRKAETFGLPPGTRVQIPSYGLMWCLAPADRSGQTVAAQTGEELDPRTLAVGVGGKEFVAPSEGGLAAARLDDLGAFRLADGSEAYLRPLFLLAEVAP